MNNQDLYQVIKDGKSGFINREGTVIIDFEFDSVSAFSEGLARIFHKEKVGFIDPKGNIIIQPIFDNAMNFSDGLAVASVGEKYGYINKQGEFVISPSYYQADDFKNGIALVTPDMMSTGCFINKKGKVILKDKYFSISKYSEGLINCSLEDKWGFIDLKNQFVIPPTFNYAREFSEGKAAVIPPLTVNNKLNKKQLFGFIDKENNEIIPPTFQGSDIKFSDGLCSVWDDGYGCIDKLGKLIIPYDFELIEHFNEGLAVYQPKGKNEKKGFINKSGDILIEPIFTYAESFQDGIASVGIGNSFDEIKHGYINIKGDYIWEPSK